MKATTIIVAGGNGSRMNQDTPKQFLLLEGKPILYHTILAFIQANPEMEIILVLPAEHLDHGKKLVEDLFPQKKINCVIGGQTRFHSVKAGLKTIINTELVLVHDAVRCLITPDLIQRCMQQAQEKTSAIPTIVSKDSIRMITEDAGNVQLDRNRIRLVQTPQVFTYNLLWDAFQADYQERFTDEANVVEASGAAVHLIEGEEENLKITFPSDLMLAAHILKSRQA